MSSEDASGLETPPSGFGGVISRYWGSIKKFCYGQYRYHTTGVLKCGPMPRHIAFIMDGNRRFARKVHTETKAGHTLGGQTLMDALRWCTELGITTITVFAFSVENFKRTLDEVNGLMQIANDKVSELLQHVGLKKYFKIRGIGDMSLLPPELHARIKELEEYTKNSEGGLFNVCFAYSSTHELTHAVRSVVHERLHPAKPATSPEDTGKFELMSRAEQEEGDISEEDLERCLMTHGSPDLDMIIRTSGEIRLSDFMLWQASACCLVITDVLWPEFSPNHLYGAILYYQEHYEKLKAVRSTLDAQNFLPSDGLSEHPSIKVE